MSINSEKADIEQAGAIHDSETKKAEESTVREIPNIRTDGNRGGDEEPQKEKTYTYVDGYPDDKIFTLVSFLLDLYQINLDSKTVREKVKEEKSVRMQLINGILSSERIEVDFNNESGICDRAEIRKILNAMLEKDFIKISQLHARMTGLGMDLDIGYSGPFI